MRPASPTSSRSAQWLMTGSPGVLALGVAEARGVPASVGLDEHEELAAVVGGVNERQAKARGRRAGGHQGLEQGAPFHPLIAYRYRYR